MSWFKRPIGELLPQKSKDLTKGIAEWSAKRALEKALLKRKETARDYEANRVPAGHEYYKLLYDACMADIDQFCKTYDHDPKLYAMGFPFLFSLGRKAYPQDIEDERPGMLTNAFAGVIGVVIIAFGLGVAHGMFNGGSTVVAHLFGK